jgi:hypothetical protein
MGMTIVANFGAPAGSGDARHTLNAHMVANEI